MSTFRVWIRPLGNTFRIRVEGEGNAQMLLQRLSQSFVFKTAEPVLEERDRECCTFSVPYTSQTTRSNLEKLLASIPEIQLMREPA